MKSDLPVAVKLWFLINGVHPGEAGHQLYAKIFARSFIQMKNFTGVKQHMLPEAVNKYNCGKTVLLPIINFLQFNCRIKAKSKT
jgi:hypothetical protein